MFQSTAIFLRASSAILSSRFCIRDAETQDWYKYTVGLHFKEEVINYAEGCLVALNKYEDEIFHARILCPASFYPTENRATALPGLPLAFFEEELGALSSEYRGLISSGKVLEETELKTQLPYYRHRTLSTMPGNLQEELQTLMDALHAGGRESACEESPSILVTGAALPTIDYMTAITGGAGKATVCYEDGAQICFDGVSVSNHENIWYID